MLLTNEMKGEIKVTHSNWILKTQTLELKKNNGLSNFPLIGLVKAFKIYTICSFALISL